VCVWYVCGVNLVRDECVCVCGANIWCECVVCVFVVCVEYV